MAKKEKPVWVFDPRLLAAISDACVGITPQELGATVVISKRGKRDA